MAGLDTKSGLEINSALRPSMTLATKKGKPIKQFDYFKIAPNRNNKRK
jgi:hypothetical protein